MSQAGGFAPRARWQALAERERRLVLWAAGLLAASVVWQLGLAPALAVLRSAPVQQERLDAQLQSMLSLQAQARALQAMPVLDAAAQRKALENAIKPMGAAAQLTASGPRLSVSVRGISAQALAQVLASARQSARLLPVEAHVQRNAARLWDGTLVFQLTGS